MKLSDVIIIILFIISIAVGLWYLFGSSPTFEQAVILFMLSLLIANIIITRENKIKLEVLTRSFIKLANDFKELKDKIKR